MKKHQGFSVYAERLSVEIGHPFQKIRVYLIPAGEFEQADIGENGQSALSAGGSAGAETLSAGPGAHTVCVH